MLENNTGPSVWEDYLIYLNVCIGENLQVSNSISLSWLNIVEDIQLEKVFFFLRVQTCEVADKYNQYAFG